MKTALPAKTPDGLSVHKRQIVLLLQPHAVGDIITVERNYTARAHSASYTEAPPTRKEGEQNWTDMTGTAHFSDTLRRELIAVYPQKTSGEWLQQDGKPAYYGEFAAYIGD